MKIIFIVGSPRSGTTILGNILGCHKDIAEWIEPYFIWDKYFRIAKNDVRVAADARPLIIDYIQKEFKRYCKKTGCKVIVDKSPRNSLKIPFIRQIFPDARFIHIIRDGRDTTLSINKQWKRRISNFYETGEDSKVDFANALKFIRKWMRRQSFVSDRIRALWFETHGHLLNKHKHVNILRWNGKPGWGPRFKDWEEEFKKLSTVQFNALQWKHCLTSVLNELELVHSSQKIAIRYEEFVQEPQYVLDEVLSFIGVDNSDTFKKNWPIIKENNYNKWGDEFNLDEIQQIKPILNPLLDKLGYLQRWPW